MILKPLTSGTQANESYYNSNGTLRPLTGKNAVILPKPVKKQEPVQIQQPVQQQGLAGAVTKVKSFISNLKEKTSASKALKEKLSQPKTNIDTTNLSPEIKQKVTENLITQTPKISLPSATVSEKGKQTGVYKTKTEADKALIKTGLGTAEMVTSSADFLVDTMVKNIDTEKPQWNIIRNAKLKFKDFYNKAEKEGKNPINELNTSVKKLQASEVLQPSEEFQKSTLKENLKKRPLETVLNIAPSILPSIVLYSVNPLLGFTSTYLSTANDIEDSALEYGVDEKKANNLGAGASIFISLLDKIVPDLKLATKTAKNTFISNMTKRVFNVLLKGGIEASTEAAQETIQMAAEKTFREDLGWSEAKTRLAMSAFGGALGGFAFGTLGNLSQDLGQDVDFKQNVNEFSPNDVQESLNNSNLDIEETKKVDELITNARKENKNIIIDSEGKGDVIIDTPEGDTIGLTIKGESSKVLEKPRQLTAPTNLLVSHEGAPDTTTVEEYKTKIQNGEEIEPIKVVREGKKYGIEDGKHRFEAYKELGINQVPIEVVEARKIIKEVTPTKEEIKQPKPQLEPNIEGEPVYEEILKTSKLGKSIESEAIKKQLTKGFEDLPEYEKVNIEEQSQKASQLLKEQEELARQIAFGEKASVDGILPEAVFIAVENKALKNNDIETLQRLATSTLVSEATYMGQRLRELAERNPYSPTSAMQKVITERKKIAEKKYGKKISKIQEQEVNSLKENLKNTQPTKSEWGKFLDSIKC